MQPSIKKQKYKPYVGPPPKIFTLNRLAFILNEKPEDINYVLDNHRAFYKPKKEMIKGKNRRIDRPFGKLKLVQRKIYKNILIHIPVPTHMYGSVTGKTIVANARVHINQKVVISVDLRDCFPRTINPQVYKVYRETLGYPKKISKILTPLTTFNRYVPQGAPTSSALINIILTPLYNSIKEYAGANSLRMSFWVDDIVLSGNEAQRHITKIIKIINDFGYAVRVKKVNVMRRGQLKAQEVTGVGVTKGLSVPKRKMQRYTDDIFTYFKAKMLDNFVAQQSIRGKIEHVRAISPKRAKQLEKLLIKLHGVDTHS